MAIKTLCEAGLKVCALNAGRALNPAQRLSESSHAVRHEVPRLLTIRKKRAESYGYMDNEYTEGIWEHEISYTTAPGTQWMWPRCFAVGGQDEFLGTQRGADGRHRFPGGESGRLWRELAGEV